MILLLIYVNVLVLKIVIYTEPMRISQCRVDRMMRGVVRLENLLMDFYAIRNWGYHNFQR